ncbi:hypothetical protein DL768_001848 [Monosporascus sp. mg162]|nr:hypothetical protein DL768_001848 [Monosporascus sp. mg162]
MTLSTTLHLYALSRRIRRHLINLSSNAPFRLAHFAQRVAAHDRRDFQRRRQQSAGPHLPRSTRLLPHRPRAKKRSGTASALRSACIHGDVELVKRMLDMGVPIDFRFGEETCHRIGTDDNACWEQEKVVEYLIECGADRGGNSPPEEGSLPRESPARDGDLFPLPAQTSRWVASSTIAPAGPSTAMAAYAPRPNENPLPDGLRGVEDADATCSPFHSYVANTLTKVQINLFEIFLAYSIEITAPGRQNRTLLSAATAHLDHCPPSRASHSPLCVLITQNPIPRNSDSVHLLLTRSTDAKVRDAGGVTPLHVACRYKDVGVAHDVLKSADPPADVGAVDALGRTPLHYACGANERRLAAAPKVDAEAETDTRGPQHGSRRPPDEGDHRADRLPGLRVELVELLMRHGRVRRR